MEVFCRSFFTIVGPACEVTRYEAKLTNEEIEDVMLYEDCIYLLKERFGAETPLHLVGDNIIRIEFRRKLSVEENSVGIRSKQKERRA